jgi:ABC-type oligopeptide transport system substrate-binding subunit
MNTLHAIGFSHVRLWPCTNPGCPPDWVQLHLAVLEAATETWDMDYPDPQDYLPLLFSARSQFNVGGFHDRVFDTLVNRATTDANAADRSRLYRHAERRLLAQAAVIPIWLQWPQWTIRRSVSGLRGAAPTGNFPVPVGGDWSRVHLQ